jgi:hypothetical protein
MPNQAQLQQAQAQQAQLQQAQAVPAIPPEQAIMNMNLQQKHAEQQGYSLPPPLPLPGMENAQQQPGAGASGNFPPGFPGFPPVPGR